tara:strand:- start:1 stop:1929 length:1929 start_codon:yes stop_codon:yes gene_type:complete
MIIDYSVDSEKATVNPYDKTRGPSDLKPSNKENQAKRADFIMVAWRKLMDKHPHFREAYDAGDIKIKDYVRSSPKSHRNKFQIEVRNSRIRKWHDEGHLIKPKDQRGTATETRLNAKDSEYWVSQQFDKMLDKVVNSYVFSVSDHWKHTWITNGAHRIKLDVRFHNPNDTGGIHRINFEYELVITDKFNGEEKTIQLMGTTSYKELMQKIGSYNFTELDNGFHPIDLYSFEQPTEALARTDHAIVFGHSNVNLTDLQRVHSYYTTINEKIRPLSSWYAIDENTIHKALKEIWGNGKPFVHKKDITSGKVHKSNVGTPGVFKTASGSKNYYITDKPYEFMLHSFMMFINGLEDSTMVKMDKFCRVSKFTDEDWSKYEHHLKYSVKIFKMCREINATRWHPNKLVHIFTLLMTLRDSGSPTVKRYGTIKVKDNDLALQIDNAVVELLNESEKAGEGPKTWVGARKSFKDKAYVRPFLNMLLVKLMESDTICLLDTDRNISDKQKSLATNKSWLSGKTLTGDTEYHHAYIDYAKGGNSLVVTEENGNVVAIEKVHNRKMNNKKMNTLQYVKFILETSENSFSSEKLKFWKNGGMEELKKNINNDKFLYQQTAKFDEDHDRIRPEINEFPPKKWIKIIPYTNKKDR